MSKLKDLAGARFGRLEVLNRTENNRFGQTTWKCRCDCGNECVVKGYALRGGATQSCGCLQKENTSKANFKHGFCHKERLYGVRNTMNARCRDKKQHRYGGRGISVCEEWAGSYPSFRKWAIESGYVQGLSIDRINNDGDYNPANCKWSTAREQGRNMSRNRFAMYKGKRRIVADWAREFRCSPYTLYGRLSRGEPVQGTKKKAAEIIDPLREGAE